MFMDSPVTVWSCPNGLLCMLVCVCVSCPRCLGVSLATCPVVRAGHLRKVSFSVMGNCYPYYTLKRCAVRGCKCVCVSVDASRHSNIHTHIHTHTAMHTHQGHCGRRVREANYTAWHFISHFAFISHKYHLHILNTKQQRRKGAGDEEEKCPRVGLKYLRG